MPAKVGLPSFQIDMWVCMPEPLSVLDRLGHEGRGLAIGLGDLLHDILVDLHAVGGVRQRAEGQAEFVLGGGHFVVVLVHGRPISSMVETISPRMSMALSTGATGK